MTMLLRSALFVCATALVAGPAAALAAPVLPAPARFAAGGVTEELHRRGDKAATDTIVGKDEKTTKDRTPANSPLPSRKKTVKPRIVPPEPPTLPTNDGRETQDQPWDTAFLVDNVMPSLLRMQSWRLVGNERYR